MGSCKPQATSIDSCADGHGEFVIEGMSDQQSLNNKHLKELVQTNMVRMCAAAWSPVLAHRHVAQFVIEEVC